jgi:hypothetical protein
MTETDTASERRKERSPSFPFVPLQRAIDRARAMATAHRRSATRPATLGETWGYAAASSGLAQTLAALKAFGLLEDIGRGADRRVQLTDLAWRILHDTRPGAREDAIREAALRPRLIAEYARVWLPARPDDHHCISELHLDRGFTEQAAALFLRVFDETVEFANLPKDDNLSLSLERTLPTEGELEATPLAETMPRPGKQYAMGMTMERNIAMPVTAVKSPPRATLPLPEGVAALEVPSDLSRQSYEKLKAWMSLMVQLAEPSNKDEAAN